MEQDKIVWLIDDQEMANFLTTHTLRINKFTSSIRSFTSAKDAIAELKACTYTKLFPDFIFLDLDMPGIDGWTFLEVYRKFPGEIKERCTLYILSSSIDEEDINKSKLYEEVRDFLNKPLDKIDLEVIKFQTTKVSFQQGRVITE